MQFSLPIYTAKNFRLNELLESDAHELMLLRSHLLVNQYIGHRRNTTPKNLLQTTLKIKELIGGINENMWYYWAIRCLETGKLIGTACVFGFDKPSSEIEIGYELHPDYWGQGIITEVVEFVVMFCFRELGVPTLIAIIHRQNLASQRVVQKNGFILDETYVNIEDAGNQVFRLRAQQT